MIDSKIRVLWCWQTMGPYHFARMKALARTPGIELTVVEATSSDDHGWIRQDDAREIRLITLSTAPKSHRTMRETRHSFARILYDYGPHVVVGPGYSEFYSLDVILAYRNSSPERLAVLWSESTAADHARKAIKETLKSLIVSAFDGALAAGTPHASYLRLLGMSAADIQVVGNCVDNEFFSVKADAVRQAGDGRSSVDPTKFFLFVGRMIPQKNVAGLIRAYHLYKQRAGMSAWELVLVGCGPDEALIRTLIEKEKIDGVRFAGLLQIEQLPHYYGSAGCFVLPSISEPWGLVVNEAMASGLPVLVSSRCGCAPDLVRDEQNGFTFDPSNTQGLADLLFRVSHGDVSLYNFGLMSREIVSAYTPALFAERTVAHFRLLRERRINEARSDFARQSLTRFVIRGLGAITTIQD
jgi:glycosyltransferase involved in cell wall biosynthesis